MKYYIIKKESGLTIMNVEDKLTNEFEKEHARNIIVEGQSSMAEALVKFGEVATQEEIQLGQNEQRSQKETGEEEIKTGQQLKHRRKP